jgi:hypothetical protein
MRIEPHVIDTKTNALSMDRDTPNNIDRLKKIGSFGLLRFAIRPLPNIKKLDDCRDMFLVRVTCEIYALHERHRQVHPEWATGTLRNSNGL